MKPLVSIIIALFSLTAGADLQLGSGDAFASCSGYHHGSYLDFFTNRDGSIVYIEVSNDGEAEQWPIYEVTTVSKGYTALTPAEFNQTFIDVTTAMIESKNEAVSHDFVYAEATGPDGSKMILNLFNFFGESYVVIDGFVEPLECFPITH